MLKQKSVFQVLDPKLIPIFTQRQTNKITWYICSNSTYHSVMILHRNRLSVILLIQCNAVPAPRQVATQNDATRQAKSPSTLAASPASTHTPVRPHTRNHTLPPSYDNLLPHHADGREDLETIHARHPPERPLKEPIRTDSPIEAAYFAGATAFFGLIRAAQNETHPYMVITRAAQAVSVAVFKFLNSLLD